jgi:hypothetical protein
VACGNGAQDQRHPPYDRARLVEIATKRGMALAKDVPDLRSGKSVHLLLHMPPDHRQNLLVDLSGMDLGKAAGGIVHVGEKLRHDLDGAGHCQPDPHVLIGRSRKPGIEQPNIAQRGKPRDHTGLRDEASAQQQAPCLALIQPRRRHAELAENVAPGIDETASAAHHDYLGRAAQYPDLSGELVRQPFVVGVEECNQSTFGSSDSLVHRTTLAQIAGQPKQSHPLVTTASHQLRSGVAAAIVHHDNFVIAVGLRKHRMQRPMDRRGGIEGRNQYSDRRSDHTGPVIVSPADARYCFTRSRIADDSIYDFDQGLSQKARE